MTITFALDPPLTHDLRDRIVALWTDVTNAGGAVGFVAPVTADEVRPVAQDAFAGVAAGLDRLVVGLDDEGRPVALLFITGNRFPLKEHWRVVKRVMVSPRRQGHGLGAALMAAAADVARDMALSALQVTVRGGMGTEAFYAGLGYREVGRLPGALRVAPGDDRDEIVMWLPLTGGDGPSAAGGGGAG